jgi:hypothetical protein
VIVTVDHDLEGLYCEHGCGALLGHALSPDALAIEQRRHDYPHDGRGCPEITRDGLRP